MTHQFWESSRFELNGALLGRENISKAVNNLWESKTIRSLTDDNIIMIIFKVKFDDGAYRSISHLEKVNKTQKDELIENFIYLADQRAEDYSDRIYETIILDYHIFYDTVNIKRTKLIINDKKPQKFTFSHLNYPITTDYKEWGVVKTDNTSLAVVFKQQGALVRYEFQKFEDRHEILVYIGYKKLLTIVDVFGDNPTSFTRAIGQNKFTFKNGELILKESVRKTQFFNKTQVHKKESSKIITLDLETRNINGTLQPYCVSYYDGVKAKSFYLTDYKNSEIMITSAIVSLAMRKYTGYKIYVHNLSNFDGVFLLRHLSEMSGFILKPVLKDGKMINLKLKYVSSGRSYSIDFRDSLLMLPLSLRKLAKAFNVENKGIFPYEFSNSNPLDYVGAVPEYKYFSGVTIDQYNEYTREYTSWDLRSETIKYCELDCKVLYQVLLNFNELIFNKFSINIHKFPTLPSLALAIFKTHYMKADQIPKIGHDVYDFVKQGYTGGHTDVYTPFGENVNAYDVNSLYPTVMQKYDMPVGTPKYFEFKEAHTVENFNRLYPEAFGFFEVEVTAPNVHKPILQTRVKTASGIRTIAPIGSWSDVIFSEEMNNAITYGYRFKVIRGYLFERANIFSGYVDEIYKIKQSVEKSNPMYLISKLLLNSLYGKFGMSDNLSLHSIIDNESIVEETDDVTVTDKLDLNNGKTLLTYFKEREDKMEDKDISIPIAAAVTAYARVYMSPYLMDDELDILYTDTDSIYTVKKLPEEVINNELGGWKLENTFTEACFIAPKVYGGLMENGNELTKVKGYKNTISYKDLKDLLKKDSDIKLPQEKWHKDIQGGTIRILDSLYTLSATDSKREFEFIGTIRSNTKPVQVDSNKATK